MRHATMPRRLVLFGALCSLGGCGAISALNTAAETLDTYDLAPRPGAAGGGRSARTLLVARPDAPAAIATDRIMVRPDAFAVTYLPEARWSDELPLVVQSLLVRSIAGTGRLGYVGPSEGGPVPDAALLVRLDAFQVAVTGDGGFEVSVDLALSLLDDRDQRVIASQSFARSGRVTDDSPTAIVAGFQALLDVLLPQMADWVVARVARLG